MALTEKDLAAFTAVVDTILPAVEGDGPAWTVPGAQLGLADQLSTVFERLPHDQDRKDLKQFLGLLNSGFGGLVLYGKAKAFTKMSSKERAAAYLKMETHRLSLVRGGAKALKTLAAFLWVATEDPNHRPASWDAMGYPGPDGPPPDVPKPIPIIEVESDTTMTCDVVIVGSGAGGGTTAGVLAGAGLDVIVLEAGGYHNESDFTHLESDAYNKMYLQKTLGSTADGGIVVLAGGTLGGGTVINYTTSFATPPSVREEWDSVSGFDEVFTGAQYAEKCQRRSPTTQRQLGPRLAVAPGPTDGKGLARVGLACRRDASKRRRLHRAGLRLLHHGLSHWRQALFDAHVPPGCSRQRSSSRNWCIRRSDPH